jgi:phage terminase large subunit GpA-like protein
MLRPPPQLTVSEWAERHRMLGSRTSAEPGPWRTSRTPYLKDVMDALSAVHPARPARRVHEGRAGRRERALNVNELA